MKIEAGENCQKNRADFIYLYIFDFALYYKHCCWSLFRATLRALARGGVDWEVLNREFLAEKFGQIVNGGMLFATNSA